MKTKAKTIVVAAVLVAVSVISSTNGGDGVRGGIAISGEGSRPLFATGGHAGNGVSGGGVERGLAIGGREGNGLVLTFGGSVGNAIALSDGHGAGSGITGGFERG